MGFGSGVATCKVTFQTLSLFEFDLAEPGSPTPKVHTQQQLGAAAKFGDRAHRQIWGPNVNNNIFTF